MQVTVKVTVMARSPDSNALFACPAPAMLLVVNRYSGAVVVAIAVAGAV